MLDTYYLGARGFVWLYLAFSVTAFLGILIYWFRETIRKKYYEIRYPEKLIKVVIHYKANLFKEFWRLLPDNNCFVIGKKHYPFDEKNLTKNKDLFAYSKNTKTIVEIDGVKYEYDGLKALKKRWSKYPEIHYIYNVPKPLVFDFDKKKIEFSSKEMADFKDNDLFIKLLTSDKVEFQTNLMLMLLFGIAIGVGVILAKMLEWI